MPRNVHAKLEGQVSIENWLILQGLKAQGFCALVSFEILEANGEKIKRNQKQMKNY